MKSNKIVWRVTLRSDDDTLSMTALFVKSPNIFEIRQAFAKQFGTFNDNAKSFYSSVFELDNDVCWKNIIRVDPFSVEAFSVSPNDRNHMDKADVNNICHYNIGGNSVFVFVEVMVLHDNREEYNEDQYSEDVL